MLRPCGLFVLLLCLSAQTWAQNCSDFATCTDCLSQQKTTVKPEVLTCYWCDAGNLCFLSKDQDLVCERDIGTHFLAAFVPVYVVLTILLVVIHYLRVHAIEPVIDFHANRRGVMDFSALLDPKIESIINTTLPTSEQLIWADVSLKISRWRHLLPSVLCFVFGGVVLTIIPHAPTVAPYLSPLFGLLTIPSLFLLYSGLHQLIKKKHYTHIYLLTTSGAIILFEGLFGKKIVFNWPYKFMVNIHTVHVMFKVASVHFAEDWDVARAPTDRRRNTLSSFQWRYSHVGFENIVKVGEVEDLIRQQVTQLSPTSSRNVAYTL